MRRLVSLVVLLLFAVPFGISMSGCGKGGSSVVYCNGANAGLTIGQLTTIDLEPRLAGISFNQGEIGGLSTPTGKDCKGSNVSPNNIRYASTNMNLVDVVPTTGRLCAGTWNRNTGGSIADYTFCTPAATSGTAFVTASTAGVTSNPVAVYVHPIVANIQLVSPTLHCETNPDSSCFNATNSSACQASGTPIPVGTVPYNGGFCVSQGHSAQLAALSMDAAGNNISCSVGPLTFSPTNGTILTIDQNGLATAAQPGSTIIDAAIAQASSSVGFFSTCPPASIVLTTVGSSTAPTTAISVNQNTTQNLAATVLDVNNNPITNIPLEFVSTNPITIPATGAAITPTFPGSAAITAICQPTSTAATGGVNNCNPSGFNQIGLYGNGLPIASNPVQITAPGTAPSTILYIASTQSQYVQPIDFTLNTQPSPLRLPYAPNSMVLSTDLSTIYMGTSTELMVLSATTTGLTLARQDNSVSGFVLSVSPDSATVIIADPVRRLTYLYTSSGGIFTQYGGYGTRAQWSPDSQTVYITTDDGRLLVHSNFTGWIAVPLTTVATDVAVTVPSVGAYLANGATSPVTARTDCPTTTQVSPAAPAAANFNTTTTNVFYPQADLLASPTPGAATRLSALNDGIHLVGATPTNFLDVTTNPKSGACPTQANPTAPGTIQFTSTGANYPLTGITVTPTAPVTPTFTPLTGTASSTGSGIVGVIPTSDAAFAFVTYTGTGGVVPQFNQAATVPTLTNIALQTTTAGVPVAPISGVISADNLTFYVGTTGDNLVHRLARGATGFTDTSALPPITPGLPNINGSTTAATPDLLAQRPRKATN